MGELRILLHGGPYPEPRYYGRLSWTATDVYVRHPGGGKDSRHSDGGTWLSSDSPGREFEQRVEMSNVTDERISVIALPKALGEPPLLRGQVRPQDLMLDVRSVGTMPHLAVEVVGNSYLSSKLAAWQTHSGVSSVHTYVDKGADQTLVVAQLDLSY